MAGHGEWDLGSHASDPPLCLRGDRWPGAGTESSDGEDFW